MTPVLSVYLDLVRFAAALVVLLAHLAQKFFPGIPLPFPGKDAVIVFFVLSGFVVAFVVDTKERHWLDYAVSRLSRLASVFVPALLLGLLLTPVEGRVGWPGWPGFGDALGATLLNAVYLGQVWTLDVTPPNNNPAWSLNYEACYYALFGLAIFVRGPWRWPMVLLAAALAGPKILILMPAWLAGCALYCWRDRLRMPARTAGLLFGLSLVAYAAYFLTDLNIHIRTALQHAAPTAMARLQWSNRFAGDMLLCLIVSLNFAAARHLQNGLSRLLLRWQAPIRAAAATTLSLYLFHAPLMLVLGNAVGAGRGPYVQGLLVGALLVPSITGLAWLTEFRRAWLKAALLRLAARPLPRAGRLLHPPSA